jgi:hypothetical protein
VSLFVRFIVFVFLGILFESAVELTDVDFIQMLASSGILSRVALVITDVSEEHSASIIRVTRISELGTTLAVTSVLTRATPRNIQEDAILHSHRRENVKSYLYKGSLE